MATKRSTTTEEKIIRAAMKLAAEKGWHSVSLADIAKAARVSLAALSAIFATRTDILAAYGRHIDAQVMDEVSADEADDGSARDRIFDVLMTRFDAMSADRTALQHIYKDMRKEPLAAAALARPLLHSMRWMLETANISTVGVAGALRVRGLALIWGSVFPVWLDDGEDQSKTMAALDERLRQAESFLKGVERFRQRRKNSSDMQEPDTEEG